MIDVVCLAGDDSVCGPPVVCLQSNKEYGAETAPIVNQGQTSGRDRSCRQSAEVREFSYPPSHTHTEGCL